MNVNFKLKMQDKIWVIGRELTIEKKLFKKNSII